MTILRNWRVALALNLITIACAIGATRSCTVDCAHCGHAIFAISPVETMIDPWADICKLHLPCAKHLSEHVLPQRGITLGQWLEEKGYDPGSVRNLIQPIQQEDYPSPPLTGGEFSS